MKYLYPCMLFVFLSASGLYAGITEYIKKNDSTFKTLKIAVDSKRSTNNKIEVTIKVVKELKPNKIGDIYLFQNKKNVKIKPVIKGNLAILKFEIDEKNLDKARLNFSYPNGSMCPASYGMRLKEYITLKGTL